MVWNKNPAEQNRSISLRDLHGFFCKRNLCIQTSPAMQGFTLANPFVTAQTEININTAGKVDKNAVK